MGRKCCVPACKSNYNTEASYIPSFLFPKDVARRALWLKSINRFDFTPSLTAVVCVQHFDEQFIIREDTLTRDDGTVLVVPRKKLMLTSDAYPTIFPNQPSYLTVQLPVKRKSPSKRRQEILAKDDEKFSEWCVNDSISSFEHFSKICSSKLDSGWTCIIRDNFVIFYRIDETDCPSISVSIKIFKDLTLIVWHSGNSVDIKSLEWILGSDLKCDKWTKFDCLLNLLVSYELKDISFEQKLLTAASLLQNCYDEIDEKDDEKQFRLKLKFLKEQVTLMSLKQLRYTSDILIWASKLYFCYPSSYSLIRNSGVLILPYLCYLKKLSNLISYAGVNNGNAHMRYLKQKASLLNDSEKIVNVLLDEIDVTPSLSYKAGYLTGISANSNSEATTIQAFMIVSLFSKCKDVVTLIPVKNLTAQTLHDYTVKVLRILSECGYTVLCLISDNNRINRNMFTIMCNGELKHSINNPQHPTQRIFFLFDTVHLVKSIRNNWLNQPNETFYYPNPINNAEVYTASLTHLKQIYEKDKNNIVKLAPKLSQKVLFPTSTERQNVLHALNLFHETNCVALEMNSDIDFEGTKTFIAYVLKWWKIVNVKYPHKGTHNRDEFCDPINGFSDEKIIFLQQFVSWLNAWGAIHKSKSDEKIKLTIKEKKGGMLSKQTHFALTFTVESLLELIKYIFMTYDCNYILLGKFQTDSLEARFGQYRQMSGGNYNVSYRQVLESERKLKILSLIDLYSNNIGEFKIKYIDHFDLETQIEDFEVPEIFYEVFNTFDDIDITVSTMSVLIFIAGYVAYRVSRKISCKLCYSILTENRKLEYKNPEKEEVLEYLRLMDRGSLKWPQEFTVHIVVHAYQVFQKLITIKYEEEFLRSGRQKILIIQLVFKKLDLLNLIPNITCSCGTDHSFLAKKCLSVITNIFLNNYTKVRNDKRTQKNYKRKLSTYKKF